MKTVTVRNAFAGSKGNFQAFYQDGHARVWDEVAGYWTTCHALTPSQIKRVKAGTLHDYYVSTDAESVTVENCKNLAEALEQFDCPKWVRSVDKFEKWLNKVGGFGRITESGVEIVRVDS